MREWFLGAELIELERTPNSLRAISQKAKREGWQSRKSGVGKAFEYHISSFSEDVIRQLQAKFGFSDNEIDEVLFWSTHGKNTPLPQDRVEQLAHKFGESPAVIRRWHKNGELDFLIQAKNKEEKELQDNIDQLFNPPVEQIQLALYDVEVSAGHGALVIQEGKTSRITFSQQFIEDEIGVNAKNIFLMPVKGDSMYPTLRNQSLIMVNRIERFSGDGIYVFRFDGQLMVKRLQFSKAGLTVVSDNLSYKEWELTRDELTTEDFEIIGEVVWSGQRM